MGESARAMDWFLDNTGKDRELSNLDIASFIQTNSGGTRYRMVLHGASEVAKNVLKDGDTVILASNLEFDAFRKVDSEVKHYNYTYFVNDYQWFTALGDAKAAIVAKIKRDGNRYHMEFRYIVYDYYDWDISNTHGIIDYLDGIPVLKALNIYDSDFAKMHLAGIARSYYVQGEFNGKFDYDKNTEPYDRINVL